MNMVSMTKSLCLIDENHPAVKLMTYPNNNQIPPPIYKWLIISNIKSLTVKLFLLFENFSDSNFATIKTTKT